MEKPKMLIFDYGQTLIAEQGYDSLQGFTALLPYIKENPQHLGAGDINKLCLQLLHQLHHNDPNYRIQVPVEVHMHNFTRFLYEYLGLSLTLSLAQAETIFWDAAAPPAVEEGAPQLLKTLQRLGIHSAVVSNLSFSGQALSARINRLLPQNNFRFILASSEYVFRKPSPYIFQLAIKKAQLPAKDIWFCGDNFTCDIMGAHSVGMQPVWYKGTVPPEVSFSYLHIQHWRQLHKMLVGL